MDKEVLEALLNEAALRYRSGNEFDANWRRGDLTHLLHSGQQKIQHIFETSPHQLQVILCARGFGKTFWGATAASSQSLKKEKSRIKIATEFQTDLESLIIPNFDQVLETCPEDIAIEWRAAKNRYVGQNGSVIDLIGLDRKPNGLRGQHNVDLILLEEAGFISKLEKIYKSVIIPITTHRPNCKIIPISTPPEAPDHYFWELVDRAEAQGSLTTFTIDENPMLSRDDIKRIEDEMGGRESDQFRREYLCERIIDGSTAILPEWSKVKDRTIVKGAQLPPFFKPVVAIDLALNDNIGVTFGYWDFPRAKAVVQRELLLNGVNSKQLVEACLPIEHELWGEGITPMRWADGQLYSLNDICSLHHYSVSMVRKDIVEAQVNSLRLMLQAGQIEIFEACKQTIKQCASGLWNKQKNGFKRSGSNHQDLLASLIYFVRHLNKENPYPSNYLYNRDTMHYRPDSRSGHLDSLKKTFGPKRAV